jgi:16S rRNA (adenine1518-N6/adenine1519-N6)-dimethyltransferase
LAKQVKRVYALEIDRGLCAVLRQAFSNSPNVRLINQDILKFDFKKHFRGSKIKVVGNIPYYITTPIIERLFKFKKNIGSVYLTVQKEFARRLVARPNSKEYGAFSCFTQYHCRPEILFYIKKGSFRPVPNVDSAFLRLDILPEGRPPLKDEALFFKVIRRAFSQRRKTLRNSLKGLLPKKKIESFLARHSLSPDIRPEGLSLQDFINLSLQGIVRDSRG